MRLFTVEYENFHVGIITWASASNSIIQYAKEIHCMFLGAKPLYLFFRNHICVLTHENVDDKMVELKVAGNFTRSVFPTEAPSTYNRFKFDPNDDIFSIESSLNCKTGLKTKTDIENSLKLFQTMRIFAGFDIIKSEL
jgi:hypothetical protein